MGCPAGGCRGRVGEWSQSHRYPGYLFCGSVVAGSPGPASSSVLSRMSRVCSWPDSRRCNGATAVRAPRAGRGRPSRTCLLISRARRQSSSHIFATAWSWQKISGMARSSEPVSARSVIRLSCSIYSDFLFKLGITERSAARFGASRRVGPSLLAPSVCLPAGQTVGSTSIRRFTVTVMRLIGTSVFNILNTR